MNIQTSIDQIELRESAVQVRLSLSISSGSGEEMSKKYHRFSLTKSTNVAALKEALSADLGGMGYPALSDAEWARIDQVVALL